MTWSVIVGPDAEADLDRLGEAERMAITEELWTWVDQGPPRGARRGIAGADAYEDELSSGRVVYLVDEAQQYVAVLRIRRR